MITKIQKLKNDIYHGWDEVLANKEYISFKENFKVKTIRKNVTGYEKVKCIFNTCNKYYIHKYNNKYYISLYPKDEIKCYDPLLIINNKMLKNIKK